MCYNSRMKLRREIVIDIEEKLGIIKVLRKEVEILTSRLQPQDTGHLHTAINVINDRIDELLLKWLGHESKK